MSKFEFRVRHNLQTLYLVFKISPVCYLENRLDHPDRMILRWVLRKRFWGDVVSFISFLKCEYTRHLICLPETQTAFFESRVAILTEQISLDNSTLEITGFNQIRPSRTVMFNDSLLPQPCLLQRGIRPSY